MRNHRALHHRRWLLGPHRRQWLSAIRLLIWLALLLAVAVGASAVLSAHSTRVTGIPRDFPAPVKEANVPLLGVNAALDRYSDRELTSALGRIVDAGFVWVRQSFHSGQIGEEGVSDGFDWSETDRIVDALERHSELRLVAVLEDDPPVPPDDPSRFAAFAGAFAERYGDRIDYYQIWDEPNLGANWGGGPVNPPAYADLLARTARAIRATDPQARILLAGLAPTRETGPQNLSEASYLERLYQVGAAPYFDIVAAKPYGFDTGPDDRRVDESILNVSRILLLRDVMVRHGDADKAIWASHWGWNSLPRGWRGAPSIWGQTDEVTQAARSVGALERARDEWPWMGGMIIETLQPDAPRTSGSSDSARAGDPPGEKRAGDLVDPRWGFSLLGPDGTPRLVYRAIADWADSLPAAAPVGGYAARNRWTTYQGGWRAGPLAADVGRPSESETDSGGASFRFDGTRVALTVRRGPYRAFLYVTIDGKPANALPRDEHGRAYVVLYDERPTVATVPLATELEPGMHTVEVVAEGGQGQWLLLDWRVGATPVRDGTSWKLAGLIVAALVLSMFLVRDFRRVRWVMLVEAFHELAPEGQMALSMGLTGLLWVTAALSWRSFTPPTVLRSACLVFSLLTVSVLAFLFALRPDVGFMLVALSAPFYLVPEAMFYRTLSLAEVLVVLCFLAYGARRIGDAGTMPRVWLADLPGSGVPPNRQTRPERRHVLEQAGTFIRMDVAVALLVLVALVAGVAADDYRAALFELRSVFLLPALYYTLLRLTPLDDRGQRRVIDGFLLGGVGVALIGLGQLAVGQNLVAAEGGLLRLQGVYHSPNSLGLYLGRVWPFLVAGAVWGRDRRRRAFSLLALAPVTLALGLSFSRGALLLALPASILVMGCWIGGRYRWMALILVGIGALGLMPLLRLPRFAALLDLGRGTTFLRLKLWQSSLRMIRENPLLGVGPGNFLDAYQTRYLLPAAWQEFNLEHAHNLLLDHWTRLGALGVAAGLAVQILFWSALRRRKEQDALALGLAGSMAALLAHGLVDNAVFFPDLALAFFLTLAMVQNEGRRMRGRGR